VLVIQRCLDQVICIGNNIKVKVLKVGQRRVTVGIDAPSSIRVWRDELPTEDEAVQASANGVMFRVLVVEDTPVHAVLIEKALAKWGVAEVVVVSSGEDAIRVLDHGHCGTSFMPDLILLDLQLPGVSGLDVLQLIKNAADLRSIPVVVLSCSDSDEEVSRCMGAGANAFVSKSQRYEDFRQSIFRIADFWSHTRSVG
jgi:two-component system, chemotaxis family, response regulator Rcp1